MHIAFLTPEYPHEKISHSGGLGTSIKNLASALVKEKIDTTIIVYGQEKDDVFTENGINIHLLKNQKYSFGTWYFHRKYIQNYCNAIIKNQKIDIIEAPDWTGITAFINLKVPLVIRFHGSDAYFCHLENRKQKLKNFWFEKLAIAKAQAFIAPTDFAGALSKQLFKIKNKPIKTIHYGLELQHFQNHTPQNFEKGLILYIGTIIRKKGVLELPAIFTNVLEKYPTAKLVLIGSDSFDITMQSQSTWELVKKQFQPKDIENVTYLGKLPYQEIQNWIKKAHICVFPTFAETLGMVTIEAMAMQKPVVSSNKGWVYEILENERSGFAIDPQDHLSFSNAIINLINNPEICLSIGKQAALKVESQFDIKKIVHDNIFFYKTIIDQ